MDKEQRRRERYLKYIEPFRTNALKIIKKMLDWCRQTPGSEHLVDEMLHSIFFLGKVKNNALITPEDIFSEDTDSQEKKMILDLKEEFPKPFECYTSHLPKRSPFSCVLDMIVRHKKQENEDQIKQSLQELVTSLEGSKNPKPLTSATICVSQKSNNSESIRYYGVSMSVSDQTLKTLVIGASCYSTWHEYVAGAVMTYYPEKEKKEYFDGTIELPENVRCQAFDISDGSEKLPCRSCGNLFGLRTTKPNVNPYGNCAEAESLSNLFKNENEFETNAQPTSPTYTEENKTKAKQSVRNKLEEVCQDSRFKFQWNGEFYTPHPHPPTPENM